MALEIKQSVRLAQQLVVTPQLQQAIRLLQLSRMELTTLIQKELTENPCLEEEEEESETVRLEAADLSHGEQHQQAKEEDKGHEHLVDEVGAKDGEFKEPANFDWENYLAEEGGTRSYERKVEDSEERPTYENVLHASETLQEHLLWQLGLSIFSKEETQIAEELIGNINDDGYLQANLEEIALKLQISLEKMEPVLKKIQEFDPLGVGARSVEECLLLQCRHLTIPERASVEHIIQNHLGDLEKHQYKTIARDLKISVEQILELEKIIHQLDPKPGRAYSAEEAQYITPDVFLHKRGDDYIVTLNDDGLPKLAISPLYRRAILGGEEKVGEKAKGYIQEKLRQALWLIKSIHQRQRTLYRVSTAIVKFQRDFFDKGPQHLKPMVLKDIAEEIHMHESTISRVTTNKYMHTPRGIFELKYFFSSSLATGDGEGIASEVVKNHIQQMIAAEPPDHPLSDQDITNTLKEKHQIDIARRTVAKYREVLKILPSSKRKRRL